MDILSEIIEHKRRIVDIQSQSFPEVMFESFEFFQRVPNSLKQSLKDKKSGVISEFKRKSPSKGNINISSPVIEVVKGYEDAGVAGISVLTDEKYFGGHIEDLKLARSVVDIPILRKEFIVDNYQIAEAKACGADAILLIARVLKKEEFIEFATYAHSLGLECLVEIHSVEELENIDVSLVDVLGINNRNLSTFETSIDVSIDIIKNLPSDLCKISESGIHTADDANKLFKAGYEGFLIGEQFMKTDNPAESCSKFISSLGSR